MVLAAVLAAEEDQKQSAPGCTHLSAQPFCPPPRRLHWSGADIQGEPTLPHGLHGVFISRYAVIGANCRIYQNVTIGEVDHKAPVIGNGCWIGAGAVLVGDIRVGHGARIGAGAVVSKDVPAGCTVVAQPPRILERE